MRKARNVLIALLVGCLSPVVIWVAGGMALYQSRKGKAVIKGTVPSMLSCSLDSDCPPGYACLNGLCVPDRTA